MRVTAKSSLYFHMKKHESAQMERIVYHCPMEGCDKKYSTKVTLRKHMVKQHVLPSNIMSTLDFSKVHTTTKIVKNNIAAIMNAGVCMYMHGNSCLIICVHLYIELSKCLINISLKNQMHLGTGQYLLGSWDRCILNFQCEKSLCPILRENKQKLVSHHC